MVTITKTKKKWKKKNSPWYVHYDDWLNFHWTIQDEFYAPVPSEIVERLVTRPEDMSPDVIDSVKLFKDQLLRMFEVNESGPSMITAMFATVCSGIHG